MGRGMQVLIVLDPLHELQRATETSLLLAAEFQRRGHAVWYALEDDFEVGDRGVRVLARELILTAAGDPVAGPGRTAAVDEFQLVLMRQDPPVDACYRFVAQALTLASQGTVVVNDPTSVLAWNEKLLPLHFPEHCPPTVVSHDIATVRNFVQEHERAVIKPLSECSGRGIAIVTAADVVAVVEATQRRYPGEPVVAQRYLPEVVAGDKRIFLAAGEFIGAVNRVPIGPDKLANIHQGARVEQTELTPRELAIVAAVGPFLKKHGLWLAGLDVIGGFLTEINVTSPSALVQINTVSGEHAEIRVVDTLESLVAESRCQRPCPSPPKHDVGV